MQNFLSKEEMQCRVAQALLCVSVFNLGMDITPPKMVNGNISISSSDVAKAEETKTLKIGDTVKLSDLCVGDIFKASGIEWMVVAKNHEGYPANSVTVMSKDILENRAFNTNGSNHWGNSSLRKYLNGEFYNKLDPNFRAEILETNLINIDYSSKTYYTQDKIFIPSFEELGLKNISYAKPVGTDYGAFRTNESRIAKLSGSNSYYWARVPYYDNSYYVCNVNGDGSHNYNNAYTESVGVRAALNLKSDILLEYAGNDSLVYNKDINKIYNANEVKKYGSWANGYYGFGTHNFRYFDAAGKWALFGNVIDEDEIAQKYIFPNGRVVTIDKYGMVNDYKTFDTTQPATVPMDGTSIKNMFLGYIDGIGLVPMMEKTDGYIWYIDNDNQARMLPIERSEYKDTLIYHKANNKSDKFLFVKNDGKLSYFNKDRFEVETKINMNDVEKVLPATNVTDDLFLMKDGTIKNLDGTAVDFQGKKLVKMLSNRYLIMDDNFIYTMQGMSIKNTNTLATLYNKAVNDLLWLKNGKVMRTDNSGNMSFLNDVNGKLVKDLVKVDETGTFILMKDNTTKSYGSVSNIGDLKAKGIDFNNIAAIVSDDTGNNNKKFIAMKDGWLYNFSGNKTEIRLVDGAITDFTGGHDYVFD
uniref:DUF6273 domain-containing protein n=1 Tax=Clostridium tyrobutyricum TaxID=1519 RepID=UPI00242B9FEB